MSKRLRDRARHKGRRGGETMRFAYIPEDVMLSRAWQTLPHAAKAILQILVVGQVPEKNGSLACTDSYAVKYGFSSRETVQRSLRSIEQRRLAIRTRQGIKMKGVPTLWAVTWWPIHNSGGWPLAQPQPPTYAYQSWRPDGEEPPDTEENLSPRS